MFNKGVRSMDNTNLRDQLLYVIANKEYNYKEYWLPYFYYKMTNSHITCYRDFLTLYPELGQFIGDGELPEALHKAGMVVYMSFGPIQEKFRDLFYNFDFHAGIYLPENFHDTQKEKFRKKLKELETMYIEFHYYEKDQFITICDSQREGNEYTAYQKLKRIVDK